MNELGVFFLLCEVTENNFIVFWQVAIVSNERIVHYPCLMGNTLNVSSPTLLNIFLRLLLSIHVLLNKLYCVRSIRLVFQDCHSDLEVLRYCQLLNQSTFIFKLDMINNSLHIGFNLESSAYFFLIFLFLNFWYA